MDETQILTINRLADIAQHHEMPGEMVMAFMSKCGPDVASGKTLCIWKSEIKEHVVMQSMIVDMDVQKMKDDKNEK